MTLAFTFGGVGRPMRMILLPVMILAPLSASGQTPSDGPLEVTSRFVTAMRSADWNTMAALMHADALRQMRGLLAVLFEVSNADDMRQQLLGVTTVAEAKALSDTAVFAAIMRATTQQDSSFAAVLRSAQVEVLGRVDEGTDTTHVVYRMAMIVAGTPVTRMDVMTLARSPHGWRGLLKGDVSALGAAISAAVRPRR